VFPLPHLALFRLLSLFQLRAVCLAVLQQAHHRTQSDLAVALLEMRNSTTAHGYILKLQGTDARCKDGLLKEREKTAPDHEGLQENYSAYLCELEHVLGLQLVLPAPRQQQHHRLVQLRLLQKV
jgi:hypothetical protein